MKHHYLILATVLLSLWGCKANKTANEKALEAHNSAIHIMDDWMRDPYITMGPDGWFYLTGTRKNQYYPNEEASIQLWKSKDLLNWQDMGIIWKASQSSWFNQLDEKIKQSGKDLMIWAPEFHFINGHWIVVNTTNQGIANLLKSEGADIKGPYTEPIGAEFGRRHDPTIFTDDDGNNYLIWACTKIAKLKPDFTGFDGDTYTIAPSNRKMGHEGCYMIKFKDKYVLFGTGWSTDNMRHGTYNLYYATSDSITGPYGERKFAGRFLGHGTPFQDNQGRWWCTAFYNANEPELTVEEAKTQDLSNTAYTINKQGLTIVPLNIKMVNGDVEVSCPVPGYSQPGAEEVQQF